MNASPSLVRHTLAAIALATAWLAAPAATGAQKPQSEHTGRTVVVEVAAFNQPFMVNRFGASVPGGQTYALLRDIKFIDSGNGLPNFATISSELSTNRAKYFGPGDVGNVTLKDYKRPRPICLRANVGDVVEVRFVNLLTKSAGATAWTAQPFAGFHITGLSLMADNGGINNDSSFVGANVQNSLVDDSAGKLGVRVYRYFADAEGVFTIYSQGDPGTVNELLNGLFGSITVQPPGAEYYRSQVTRADLLYATLAVQEGGNLPPNMLLHRPGGTDRPDVWTLTTFESRLHHDPRAAVPVVVRPPSEQLVSNIAQSVTAQKLLTRNLETGSYTLSKTPLAKITKESAAAGTENPSGFLYSAETNHPLVDYSITYPSDYRPAKGDARAGNTPVLRMLYPVAKSLLGAKVGVPASATNTEILPTALSYTIKEASPENPSAGYGPAIAALDTGTIPARLENILQAWGIATTPNTTVTVVPERSYVSEVDPAQLKTFTPELKLPIKGYIWLVSGLVVNDKPDSSIIIQGEIFDGAAQTKQGRLYFLEAELQLFHTDPTAIVTGPQAGRFPLSQDSRSFTDVPAEFDRRQPYREFALGYHNPTVVQSFPHFAQNSPLNPVLGGGTDAFAINYGISGIGAEILANRLGVGPGGVNGDEVDLKFEEFFLSAWATGDPAMLVDRPANAPDQAVLAPGTKDNPADFWKVTRNGAAGAEEIKANPKERAEQVFYPDDPSNVYHSYMRDHVKMRIYNAGTNIPHVHHLHAHQWLRSPDSDEGAYLDSQLIVPGSAFSLEMVYGGSGNRNQTVGDSIFHCHFYTHFAKGMWSLWRVHDVFEDGTLLDDDAKVRAPDPASTDPKLAWVRALPDGEIHNGSPIPAIVPMPTLAIAPFPAHVRLTKLPEVVNPPGGNVEELAGKPDGTLGWVNVKDSMGRVAQVEPEYAVQVDEHGNKKMTGGKAQLVMRDGAPVIAREKKKDGTQGAPIYKNPGYPFFVPGIAGHRPPHPPLALGWEETAAGVPDLKDGKKVYIDGGLPRHQVLGGRVVREFHTKWDFTKDFIRYEKDKDGHEKPADGALVACLIPEEGTQIERAAMNAHATRTHRTVQPNGAPGNFLHNGLPPVPGAPYADPAVDDNGNFTSTLRRYKAAVIQKNVVFNKQGVHYPQQRFITLWQDVKPTFDKKRSPEPFFFRANGGETIEYWHTNLLPDYYEMDDYQVRTPTDIVGQHIHLVKFDVTASDGAENGFNYEEGTLAPGEVRGRIDALERTWANLPDSYGLFAFNNTEASTPGGSVGVATVNWSKLQPALVAKLWEGSYLQREMSQGIPVDPKATPEELAKLDLLRPPPGQDWNGAMTTIERFSTDPLLNNRGEDRTVRSVFTHDHFGPSTHQQAGLYGALLVEPAGSRWRDPVTGGFYYDTNNRTDGGPTGFEAIIELPKLEKSYREFALEFQDLSLAYNAGSPLTPISADQLDPKLSKFFQFTATPPKAGDPPPLPKVGDPVSAFQVNGAASLLELFKKNGVTLAPTAEFFEDTKTKTLGIQDLVNYNYGPGTVAFTLIAGATAGNWTVRLPNLPTWAAPDKLPGGTPNPLAVSPEIISQGRDSNSGVFTVNYRSEPLTKFRKSSAAPNGANDAFDFASIRRDSTGAIGFDVQPSIDVTTGPPESVPPLFNRPVDPARINGLWYDPVGLSKGDTGVNDGQISIFDPMTPLLRAYQNDQVQVRVLVGAYQAPHSLMVHGLKWLHQPLNGNSGYRNAQAMGISEHYELLFRMPPATTPHTGPNPADTQQYSFADYLYAPSAGIAGLDSGVWGLLRSYDPPNAPLATKPTFPSGSTPPFSPDQVRPSLHLLPKQANPRFLAKTHTPTSFKYPPTADVEYDVTASKGTLVYNDAKYIARSTDLLDAGGLLFAVTSVKVKGAATSPAVTTAAGDPLILRARAGEWVKINFTNTIPGMDASLHPSLVGYDVTGTKAAPGSDGANVGFNPVQTVQGPAGKATYWWYAGEFDTDANGDFKLDANGVPIGRPVEYGTVNLLPPGYLTQPAHGLVGALIVEPADAHWDAKYYVSAQAEIKRSAAGERAFKECVLIQQNNVTATATVPTGTAAANATVPAANAVNLRSEPFKYRPKPPEPASSFSNSITNGKDPKTPVFGDDKNGKIFAGEAVRLRVLRPGGDVTPNGTLMFELHGHAWQQEPWTKQSLQLGDNPETQTLGAEILAPFEALNILLDSAGGPEKVPGDYLYYNYPSANGGGWGIFRVTADPNAKPKP